jgi:hypothetical protein
MNDKELLKDRMDAGRAELLAAVSGMTEAQAAANPPDGGWSALAIVEHVATVETAVMRRVTSQATVVEQEMSREREPTLYDMIAARGRKFQAPEIAHPKGRYATLSEAIAAFESTRAHSLRWLESCDFDLRMRSVEHPAFGGVISSYEMLLIAAAHVARHARQIVEARSPIEANSSYAGE